MRHGDCSEVRVLGCHHQLTTTVHMFDSYRPKQSEFVLDVGGEGRHPDAWNLNPSAVRTIGKNRGEPIPQHICGRGDDIPLPTGSVDILICERTPLQVSTLREMARVIDADGVITLRHARFPFFDPHAIAKQFLTGLIKHRITRIDRQIVQETEFQQSISLVDL